jgi:hypothetical protein
MSAEESRAWTAPVLPTKMSASQASLVEHGNDGIVMIVAANWTQTGEW